MRIYLIISKHQYKLLLKESQRLNHRLLLIIKMLFALKKEYYKKNKDKLKCMLN